MVRLVRVERGEVVSRVFLKDCLVVILVHLVETIRIKTYVRIPYLMILTIRPEVLVQRDHSFLEFAERIPKKMLMVMRREEL